MSNYSKSLSTGDWELVYDASASGDFNGYVQVTNGTDAFVYVGDSKPSITAIGGIADIHPRQITALASSSDKIYAKRGSGAGVVSLMSINTVQIVAGQSAVGSVPVNPPVGIAAVDGEGKNRAVRSDADGRLNVITPDCADVSGSVSSADVLFSVDMLNYQSIMVFTTSAGTSCTIVYEQSNDNSTNWSPVAGLTPSGSTIIGGPTSQSVSSSVLVFPKRLRYFRARVSVYGSGTVSVGGSATSNPVSTAAGAICWGVANEGSSVSGSPVTIGAEARTSSKTSVSNGQVVRPIATVDGRLVMRPHSIPENEWAYAPPSGGLVNSTAAVVIKAAAGASIRNYITSVQVMAEALTNATELTIENGDGTVLWRTKIPTTGLPIAPLRFDDPIKGTANASLQIRTVTASGTGAVYVNAQGYIAP